MQTRTLPAARCVLEAATKSSRRTFSGSATVSFQIPPRYGSGPLYRNSLSPAAATLADAPVLRMLMVCIHLFTSILSCYTHVEHNGLVISVRETWSWKGNALCKVDCKIRHLATLCRRFVACPYCRRVRFKSTHPQNLSIGSHLSSTDIGRAAERIVASGG